MDWVREANKFMWRAREVVHPDERAAHLKMAEWCLSKATESRHDAQEDERAGCSQRR